MNCAGQCQDSVHYAGQSVGKRLLRELQLEAQGRTAQWRNLLHAQGGKDHHRGLAAALQHLYVRTHRSTTSHWHPKPPCGPARTDRHQPRRWRLDPACTNIKPGSADGGRANDACRIRTITSRNISPTRTGPQSPEIPFSTRRTSTRALLRTFVGRSGLITDHSKAVKSNRAITASGSIQEVNHNPFKQKLFHGYVI
ncbi:hypothetical protein SAMN03159406_04991 [Rhizobium sp. NFR03]|nr:hypothetical protein SAMN03159406_04991 [Rhizobium sp. NFR03]